MQNVENVQKRKENLNFRFRQNSYFHSVIDTNKLNKAVLKLRAITSRNLAKEIFSLLERDGRMNQTEIIIRLRDFDQPQVAENLRRLSLTGWIKVERKGKFKFYQVDLEHSRKVNDSLNKFFYEK